MICRENFFDIESYRVYLADVRRNSAQTLDRRRSQLRHLLEWADDVILPNADSIRPTFSEYLETARNDGRDNPLAHSTIKATCSVAQSFFRWATRKFSRRYRHVTIDWIETLRSPTAVVATAITEHELFTIDHVRKVIALPAATLTEQRNRAAVAFLFLSGARLGAFVSLPIHAIDLEKHTVKQSPTIGVRTKNGKSAITYLLDIPDLLMVVARWDALVRRELPSNALWCATLARDGMSFTGKARVGKGRGAAVRKGIKELCRRAGITYRSPHKLRHGHAVYAIKRAQDMADLKAISQNLMHRNLTTTEGIYGGLPSDDLGNRIGSLMHQGQSVSSADTVIQLTTQQLEQLLDNRDAALVNAVANAVIERLSDKTGSAPQSGCPPLVGAGGFEPPTSRSRSVRASRAALRPEDDVIIPHSHCLTR